MRLLSTLAPEVYQEFEKVNHAISRLEQPFSQVWLTWRLKKPRILTILSKKVKIRRAEEKKVTDRRQKLVWSLTSRGKEPSHRLEEDRYDNPHSTKGGEREQRGVSSAPEIHINFGKTPIPKQWAKYMSSPVKKTQMVRE
ncbi:hypothetical protein OS493_013434 [Desmophyllum pertusum]|uniref:Uncharacterized protein n=1 Tax=Desmophyllum pertusum TaxID=174260 RepID=A0A9X0CFP1_9CNID|nr:hypothetical protein OS493_013434 [Desmophyllum pertusum]